MKEDKMKSKTKPTWYVEYYNDEFGHSCVRYFKHVRGKAVFVYDKGLILPKKGDK